MSGPILRVPFGTTSLTEMQVIAGDVNRKLETVGFNNTPSVRQAFALAEEVGEFIGAVRRWSGMARRSGPFDEVCLELADVAITAFVTAAAMGIDLPQVMGEKLQIIYTRGWREENG